MSNPKLPSQPPSDVISAFRAITTILVGTILMAAVFMAVGKVFIWDQYRNITQADRHLQEFQARVKADPGNLQNRLGLGFGYYQKGQYEDALKEYKKVLEVDKNNFSAYLNMGYTYIEMEKLTRAMDSLKKAIELGPKSFQAHFALGQVFYKSKKYEQGAMEFDKAFVLSPNSVPPLYWQALCYEKMGLNAEAEAMLQQALSYDPNFQDAKNALARLEKKQEVQ